MLYDRIFGAIFSEIVALAGRQIDNFLPRFTDGIVLLQANGPYERDQWFHSLLWKFSVLNHKKSLKMTSCPEIIAKELKVFRQNLSISDILDNNLVHKSSRHRTDSLLKFHY